MNRFFLFIFSPKTALVSLLFFAIAMATATFVENDFGTQTARTVIYNSWWFELLMLLIGVNFLGNIFRYRLWSKTKIPILLFHVAFIIILIGAGISRYVGFEGIMRIREGQASNTIISQRNYVQLKINKGDELFTIKKEAYFSPIQQNDFNLTQEFEGHQIRLNYKDFIADASLQLQKNALNGKPIIEIVMSDGKKRSSYFLRQGESLALGDSRTRLSLGRKQLDGVQLLYQGDSLQLISEQSLDIFIMATQQAGKLEKNKAHPLVFNALYKGDGFSFVPVNFEKKGVLQWRSVTKRPKDNKDDIDDVLLLNLDVDGVQKEISLTYRHGFLPKPIVSDFKDLSVEMAYGSIPVSTDFFVKLNDFDLKKYPGSTSPSSYTSDVTVIDGNSELEYSIYMNHVLDYNGHRFFQASYDSDEKGNGSRCK